MSIQRNMLPSDNCFDSYALVDPVCTNGFGTMSGPVKAGSVKCNHKIANQYASTREIYLCYVTMDRDKCIYLEGQCHGDLLTINKVNYLQSFLYF